jgi:hypothetical protein
VGIGDGAEHANKYFILLAHRLSTSFNGYKSALFGGFRLFYDGIGWANAA